MTLQYLDFDYSEDEHGHGSFDAMASVPAPRLTALHAEIAQVLDWAFGAFPGMRAPLEEGGEWDFHLESQQEWTADESIRYDEDTRQFFSQINPPGEPRHMVNLSLVGSPQFCDAFRQQMAI
jgi:hypothetical protein